MITSFSSISYSLLIEQIKDAEGFTEQLKAENQMEWVARMYNIEARARVVVTIELIYGLTLSKY